MEKWVSIYNERMKMLHFSSQIERTARKTQSKQMLARCWEHRVHTFPMYQIRHHIVSGMRILTLAWFTPLDCWAQRAENCDIYSWKSFQMVEYALFDYNLMLFCVRLLCESHIRIARNYCLFFDSLYKRIASAMKSQRIQSLLIRIQEIIKQKWEIFCCTSE